MQVCYQFMVVSGLQMKDCQQQPLSDDNPSILQVNDQWSLPIIKSRQWGKIFLKLITFQRDVNKWTFYIPGNFSEEDVQNPPYPFKLLIEWNMLERDLIFSSRINHIYQYMTTVNS